MVSVICLPRPFCVWGPEGICKFWKHNRWLLLSWWKWAGLSCPTVALSAALHLPIRQLKAALKLWQSHTNRSNAEKCSKELVPIARAEAALSSAHTESRGRNCETTAFPLLLICRTGAWRLSTTWKCNSPLKDKTKPNLETWDSTRAAHQQCKWAL